MNPNTFAVTFGQITQGDLNSLLVSDNDALRLCKYLIPNQVVAPISVQASGKVANGDLASLAVRLKSRMVNPGSYEQRLALFDFSMGLYSSIDRRSDHIGMNWNDVQLSATVDPSRYVSTGDVIRIRYEVFQTGISALSLWCHDVDLVEWDVLYKL